MLMFNDFLLCSEGVLKFITLAPLKGDKLSN